MAKGEPGVGRAEADRWQPFEAAKLDELLADGESRTAFMLRYTLSHPDINTIIAGTLNPDHLAENGRVAAQGPLPADTYAEAKRRLTAAGEKPAPAA